MKNSSRLLISCGTALAVILALFVPFFTALAADADLTATLDFIDSVSLTDRAGNPFEAGDNIEKDAELLLTYEFSVDNDADVFDTDYFRLPVPDEIRLTVGPDLLIEHSGSGDLIAVVSKDMATHELRVTFTEHVAGNSNVRGEISLELAFDDSNIGKDDPTKIYFDVGGGSSPVVIEIDFLQPEPTVQKSGDYNEDTRQITWTITANPEEVGMTDGVIIETIPDGLVLVPDSVQAKEGGASWRDAVLDTDYTYDAGVLVYTLLTPTTATQEVRFNTTLDDSLFLVDPDDPSQGYRNHGTSFDQNNQVTLTYYFEAEKLSNNAGANVPVNFIEKTGSYDSDNKEIDWTVTVNKIGVYIPDAVITDAIPDGLHLNTLSVRVDGTLLSVTMPPTTPGAVHYDAPALTISLGEISAPHVITFSTDVDSGLFEENGPEDFVHQFTNTASLSGDRVPGNASDANNSPVGVPSSVIDKTGEGYNAETHEITWHVTVNTNGLTMSGGEITDDIPDGQTFVPGSVRVKEGAADWRGAVEGSGDDYEYADPTLVYTLPATISEQYIVEFKTTVDDETVYANNRSKWYYNTATMTWGASNSESDQGRQRAVSEVIDKRATAYNYQTRILSWQIQINQNETDLPTPVIADVIEEDQELVLETFAITSASGTQTGTLEETLRGWTYTFDGAITQEYIITFDTKVIDLTRFDTNGEKRFSNEATITTSLVPTGVLNSGGRNIRNTVIGKTGEYTPGYTYIDWTITLNTNDLPLETAQITDQLQEGLSLVTTSVKLYAATANVSSGYLEQGEEIALGAGNVSYSVDTNLFTFNIPAPVSGGYMLKFRTDVTDKSQSPFSNQAFFSGTGSVQQGDSAPIDVSWSGAGSSGTSEVGSMTIMKSDAEDGGIMLEGAEFELEDKYGNIVARETSGSSGEALFERLRFDVDYIIRETSAPDGYIASDFEYAFQIDSAQGEDKDLQYPFANARVYGSVQVTKYGEGVGLLGGAEFTLFDSEGAPIKTALSDDITGIALFENVRWGDYTIRETDPPEGFLISEQVHAATVSEHGTLVIADPASQTDGRITGSIQLLKTNSSDTPLGDTEYKLYDAADTEMRTPLATVVTEADGIALFENVPYGDYLMLETDAPSGYSRSRTPVQVSVTTHGETVDAGVMINYRYGEDSPDTGDDIFMTIGILLTSISALGLLLLIDRRMREKAGLRGI